MFKISTPAPDHIRQIRPQAAGCSFVTYDSPKEMIEHAVACRTAPKEMIKKTIEGDASHIAASDAMLTKFESTDIVSHKKAWVNDVCGGLPDVPAFIAGHPMNMRRRVIRREASAPIALVMELTGSVGLQGTFSERGACYLALARLLTSRRPVELYLSTTYGGNEGMGAIFFRIKTDPLEIAVAAHALNSRELLQAMTAHCGKMTGASWGWAWESPTLERLQPEITYAPAFPHVTNLVVFPAPHLRDAQALNPQQWVADQYARLSGDAEAA